MHAGRVSCKCCSNSQNLLLFFFPSGLDGDNLLDKARVDEIVEYLVEVKTAGFKLLFPPTDPVNMIGYFVFWFSKNSACHKYMVM